MKRVYLSLGSNLGDRAAHLESAIERLGEAGIEVVARSAVYETEPQDVVGQPCFLNLVVEAQTRRLPVQLLTAVKRIERRMGRVRDAVRRGPRVIDIDILLYESVMVESADLVIPHPRMQERRFVLEPLVELAPEGRDPRTGRAWRSYLGVVGGQALRRL